MASRFEVPVRERLAFCLLPSEKKAFMIYSRRLSKPACAKRFGGYNPPFAKATEDTIKDRQRPDGYRDTLPGVILIPRRTPKQFLRRRISAGGPDGYRDNCSVRSR